MLILDSYDARNAVCGCHEDFDVVSDTLIDKSRWSLQWECVLFHRPTCKHYLVHYSSGATELQDEEPFEYKAEVVLKEVVLKEVTVMKWVTV